MISPAINVDGRVFLCANPLHTFMLIQVDSTAQASPTTAELKTHLRVDGSLDDAYIADIKIAAIEYIEHETGRDYRNHTWDYNLASFPKNRIAIEIPRSPALAVSSVKYWDDDGTQQTWSSANYVVTLPTYQPGIIEPITTKSWPGSQCRVDSVTVRFTTGYSTVPEMFNHCVKLFVGSMYENREHEIVGTISSELKFGLHRLTDQLRTVGYV